MLWFCHQIIDKNISDLNSTLSEKKIVVTLSDEVKESFTWKIPMKRFGDAKEVADAVAFLLSDHSTYITGEILKVNGGMYM